MKRLAMDTKTAARVSSTCSSRYNLAQFTTNDMQPDLSRKLAMNNIGVRRVSSIFCIQSGSVLCSPSDNLRHKILTTHRPIIDAPHGGRATGAAQWFSMLPCSLSAHVWIASHQSIYQVGDGLIYAARERCLFDIPFVIILITLLIVLQPLNHISRARAVPFPDFFSVADVSRAASAAVPEYNRPAYTSAGVNFNFRAGE